VFQVHHVDDPHAVVDVREPTKVSVFYSNGSIHSIPRCHSSPKPISFQQNGWVVCYTSSENHFSPMKNQMKKQKETKLISLSLSLNSHK
jgi:hypothetical protein